MGTIQNNTPTDVNCSPRRGALKTSGRHNEKHIKVSHKHFLSHRNVKITSHLCTKPEYKEEWAAERSLNIGWKAG